MRNLAAAGDHRLVAAAFGRLTAVFTERLILNRALKAAQALDGNALHHCVTIFEAPQDHRHNF